MNNTLATAGRTILKDLLSKCTEREQVMFKRMYASNIDININDCVDLMLDDKISHAITQCENTLKLKNG